MLLVCFTPKAVIICISFKCTVLLTTIKKEKSFYFFILIKRPPAKSYLYHRGCSEGKRNKRHAGRVCVSFGLLLPLGYSLLCSGLFAYSVFILSPQLSKSGLISSVSEPLGGVLSLFYLFCSRLTANAIEVGENILLVTETVC